MPEKDKAGLSLQISTTYIVHVPQKDIDDLVNRCTTDVSDEEAAQNVAFLNIEACKETPLSFKAVKITPYL